MVSVRLESLGNYHAHVKKPLCTVAQAGGFARSEFTLRSSSYAFVPTLIC